MTVSPRTYCKISEPTWELVRGAYLSGLSATVVSRRFGVSVSALRKRAARHGWTKKALADLARPPAEAARPRRPVLDVGPDGVVRLTLEEAARALVEGRPYAARACASAGLAMSRLMELHPRIFDATSVHEAEARRRYLAYAMRYMALDLADRLARGEPLPEHYRQVEAEWRETVGRDPGLAAAVRESYDFETPREPGP